MDKIIFLIKLCDNSFFTQKALCVSLELQNKGNKDVYINSDSLLIDGFTSNKFRFSSADSNSSFEAVYKGPNIKYLPQKILLKSGSKLISFRFNSSKLAS